MALGWLWLGPAVAETVAPAPAAYDPGPWIDTLAVTPPTANLQAVVVASDGTVYVSANEDKQILRIRPDGGHAVFAKLPIHPHGLVLSKDRLVVAGHVNKPSSDPNLALADRFANLDGRILVLDRNGRIVKSIAIDDPSQPNGLAQLDDHIYLLADSVANLIRRVDIATGTVSIWARDPLMQTTVVGFPGANGLKIHDGWVYTTNTQSGRVIRVKLDGAGLPRGGFEVVGDAPRADELAVAGDGTVYVSTHRAMIKITADGHAAPLFPCVEGGSALALAADEKSIFIVTDGAMVNGAKRQERVMRIWFDR